MSQVINMKVNGEVKEFPLGISFEEIANEYQQKYDETIVLAVYNGKIHELWKKPEKEGTLTFLTLKEDAGYKSYVRSAIFLLIKAIYDVVEEESKSIAKKL